MGSRTSNIIYKFILYKLIAGIVLFYPLSARAVELEKYQVEAAYIYNLTKFVEWPSDSEQPYLLICIVGSSTIADFIRNIVKYDKSSVYNTLVSTRASLQDVSSCSTIYIEAERLENKVIPEEILNSRTLLVGNSSDFLSRGGTIQIGMKSRQVVFSVNLTQAKKSGLKISGKLLTLAESVFED